MSAAVGSTATVAAHEGSGIPATPAAMHAHAQARRYRCCHPGTLTSMRRLEAVGSSNSSSPSSSSSSPIASHAHRLLPERLTAHWLWLGQPHQGVQLPQQQQVSLGD